MATGQYPTDSDIATSVRIDYDIDSISHIFQWAQGKRGEIDRAFRMKGGWEGWLQVELAMWLEDQIGPGLVVREQHVYNDSALAVDILVETPSGTLSFFELKCESVHQDCRFNGDEIVSRGAHRGPGLAGPIIPAFAKRLEEELKRTNKIAAAYGPCQYTVLGISLTRDALNFAEAEKARDDNYFMAVSARTVRGANADPNDTFALWYKSAIVREQFDLGGGVLV